ncbi:MAG TPA: hypothetical protein VHS97_10115 [Isosphaeraceae bacterium]|nr:hypothetical protein [Isosphaeraceae bacterium]
MTEKEPCQAELKFIGSMTGDNLQVLEVCLIYGTRAGEESENSLVIRSIGDFGQSIVAAWNLVREGLINPVKRELRFVIESTVKYLYVDQQIRNGATIPKLPDRLDSLFARSAA